MTTEAEEFCLKHETLSMKRILRASVGYRLGLSPAKSKRIKLKAFNQIILDSPITMGKRRKGRSGRK